MLMELLFMTNEILVRLYLVITVLVIFYICCLNACVIIISNFVQDKNIISKYLSIEPTIQDGQQLCYTVYFLII